MIIGLPGNKTHNDAGVKDDRMINNTITIYEFFLSSLTFIIKSLQIVKNS